MKAIKYLSAGALSALILAAPLVTLADDSAKAKPYTLDKCIVSDEKLGDMGAPYVFEYKGQEIKLCCKSCQKDFDKNPAKYMKKLAAAEKKAGKAKN
jgi:YHS domain-containing protein